MENYCSYRTWVEGSHQVLPLPVTFWKEVLFPCNLGTGGDEQFLLLSQVPLLYTTPLHESSRSTKGGKDWSQRGSGAFSVFLKILPLRMRGMEWEQVLLGQGNGMGILAAGEGL